MAHYRIIDHRTPGPAGTIFTFYRQFANPSFNLCVPI
ncbi:chloramphenicol acetyltransferase, partial [Klebsiella pneumoniae]